MIAGASYAGALNGGGAVVFSLSRDGRHVVGFRMRQAPATGCLSGPNTVAEDGPGMRVAADGRFHGDNAGPASELTVQGRVMSGGRATGHVTYSDRDDCSVSQDFSARVERRLPAGGPLVFTLASGYPFVGALGEMPDGSILVAAGSEFDNKNEVRRIRRDGRAVTIAGRGAPGHGGDGGPAVRAGLFVPSGVAVAGDGSILIADNGNDCVRRVARDGRISTVAGRCLPSDQTGVSTGDGGPATAARVDSPNGIAALPGGGFLFSEQFSGRVRKVSAQGIITTVAGGGPAGALGDGGPATAATLSQPSDVVVTPDGGFLVDDVGDDRIRGVGADGTITTVAGGGSPSASTGIGEGGPATAAVLDSPFGLSAATNAFAIADNGFGRIRQFTLGGKIVTRAGGGTLAGDGVPAADAELGSPDAVLATREGGLAIAVPGRILYVPPRHTHWLLIALRNPALSVRQGRNADLRLVTTAGARITVDVRRGRRTVRSEHFTARSGANQLHFGRGLRRGAYTIRVTARSGKRIASGGGRLRIR